MDRADDLLAWHELSRLKYPLRFVATLENYATGEAVLGLLIGYAATELELRGILVEAWNNPFVVDARVRPGWDPPEPYSDLLSPVAKRVIEQISDAPSYRLVYAATLRRPVAEVIEAAIGPESGTYRRTLDS